MHFSYTRSLAAAIALTALIATSAVAAPSFSELSVLTYNVAGLPPFPGQTENPLVNIPLIAPLLDARSYDVVAIQEAFVPEYYATLATQNTGLGGPGTHYQFFPPQEPLPPPPTLGASGLMRLSNSDFGTSFERVTWDECFGTAFQFGSDCDAEKGYSFARHEVGPGAFVDIYNLHADAGQDDGSRAARRDNIDQLMDAIVGDSEDHAVIVLGDTNSRYTYTTDNIRDMLSTDVGFPGLGDVWVDLVNGGVIPVADDSKNDTGCATDPAGSACERIDKIFYRSSGLVELEALSYLVPDDIFQDGNGDDLSDHKPVQAIFGMTVIPEPGTALQLFAGLMILSAHGRTRRRRR